MREVLAYFGYPVAQEHAAERAVHAALALAEHQPMGEMALPAGLAIRIGVASGLVVADPDGEVLGETPGEAARLQNLPSQARSLSPKARGGSPAICSLIATLGPLVVRGVAGPVQAWQVLGRSALGSRSEALHAAALTPLVGREEELHTLLRAWQQAKSGEGRLVLVSGEPGIGKSRLLAALEDAIGRLSRMPACGISARRCTRKARCIRSWRAGSRKPVSPAGIRPRSACASWRKSSHPPACRRGCRADRGDAVGADGRSLSAA